MELKLNLPKSEAALINDYANIKRFNYKCSDFLMDQEYFNHKSAEVRILTCICSHLVIGLLFQRLLLMSYYGEIDWTRKFYIPFEMFLWWASALGRLVDLISFYMEIGLVGYHKNTMLA